jgi:hypothetical protein
MVAIQLKNTGDTMPERHKDFPGQRAFCMFVNNAPAALVIADQFLLPSEVRQRYIDHTGFENMNVGAFCFGPNVLEFDYNRPDSGSDDPALRALQQIAESLGIEHAGLSASAIGNAIMEANNNRKD